MQGITKHNWLRGTRRLEIQIH